MTSTRTPAKEDPGNQKPNHEPSHGNPRGQIRRPAPTGVRTSFNALAFSTLLSSQETDAHRRKNYHSPPGQPLNLTLKLPSCQPRSESFREAKRHIGLSRHQATSSVSLVAARAHARPSKVGSSVAPRVQGRLPAFRPLGASRTLRLARGAVKSRLLPTAAPALTVPHQASCLDVGGEVRRRHRLRALYGR